MKTNSSASSCISFAPYQNNMGNIANHVSSTHMPYNTQNTYNSFYNTNQNIY